MPNNFSFKPDRKLFFSGLLSRIKPRLSAARISFFISECEREIGWCLSGYPVGWNPGGDDSALLREISNAAYSLISSMRQLNRSTQLALVARLLGGNERGVSLQMIAEHATDIGQLLDLIRDEAIDLKDGPGTPVNVRFSEELAWRLALAYVCAFNQIPSLRHDGIYKIFVNEITVNDLPSCFHQRIGKRQFVLANERARVHLDAIQVNKTVTNKT